MRLCLAVFCCFLMLCPRLAAAESWCSPTTPPSLSVKAETDEITYDLTRSEKDLNQYHVTTENPYGNEVISDVGGLMQGGITMNQEMSFGTIENRRAGQICYWHDTMEVTLRIKPTVYIASEFPKGSCMFNAIMAHELGHVAIDRKLVNKYARLLGQALKDEVETYRVYGPVPASQAADVEKEMKDRAQSILESYTRQLSVERRAAQQALDSRSEYDRVNRLCPR